MTNLGVVGICQTLPELRESASGKVFCTFSLGVQPWAKNPEERSPMQVYKVTCFSSLAIHVNSMVKKGQRVIVAGTFEVEHWTGKDGTEKTTNKILAEGVGFDLRFATPKALTSEMSVAHT